MEKRKLKILLKDNKWWKIVFVCLVLALSILSILIVVNDLIQEAKKITGVNIPDQYSELTKSNPYLEMVHDSPYTRDNDSEESLHCSLHTDYTEVEVESRKYVSPEPNYSSAGSEVENPWGTTSTTITSSGIIGMSKNMSAVSDSSGYVHLTYIDSSNYVQYQKYTTSWQTAVALDSTATNEYPTIAIDTTANGGIYAFWVRNVSGDDKIFYRRGCSPYGSTDWDSALMLETSGTNDWTVAGYEDFGSGKIFAEWTQGSTSPYDIEWKSITPSECGGATINISGKVCSGEPCTGSNPSAACGATSNVALSINGGTPTTTTCNASDGSYSFSSVSAGSGDIITIFLDEDSADAAIVYSSNGSNVSDLDFYDNIVVARHDDSGPVNIGDMANYDSDQQPSDIRFDAETGSLVVEAGYELHIWTGDNFTPGGTVTTNPTSTAAGVGSDIHIASGATFNAEANAVSCGGDWNNEGTFSRSAGQTTTFTATGSGFTITDGGSPFYNITFSGASGEWLYKDGADGINQTSVTAGTPGYLNTKRGTQSVSVTGGTLNIDWYLGVKAVSAVSPSTPVNTGADDITISENSAAPVSKVWKWSGGGWGSPGISQTTETDENGIIPSPGTDGAIRIREYSKTSVSTTYYKYNLYIDWQTNYGEYDYYQGYDDKYITSTASDAASGVDKCIGDNWKRASASTQNTPAQSLDDPPTNGTWYNGMIIGLEFTLNSASADFGDLTSLNNFTSTSASTQLTTKTSASNGYSVYLYSTDELRNTVHTSHYIDYWPGTYSVPTAWTGNCPQGSEWCGFGYRTDDSDLSQFTGSEYAGFTESSPGNHIVAKETQPITSEVINLYYKVSTNILKPAGPYQTTLVYVCVAQY